MEIREKYEQMIKENTIFVFMKGNPQAPMCGFSQNTCFILDLLGKKYGHYDVLQDQAMRQKVKEFS